MTCLVYRRYKLVYDTNIIWTHNTLQDNDEEFKKLDKNKEIVIEENRRKENMRGVSIGLLLVTLVFDREI